MQSEEIPANNSKRILRDTALLAGSILFIFAILILAQQRMWLTQEWVVTHDTLRHYGPFAYFADCIQHWILPLWDPYLETGQPFWVISPGAVYAWQPWTLAAIFFGKWFGVGLLNLYQYDLLIRYLIFSFIIIWPCSSLTQKFFKKLPFSTKGMLASFLHECF